MLRLGKLTDYATVILSFMAKNQAHRYAALEISSATGIALPTVSKVLKSLLKAHLLSSVRGAKGGYILVQTPDKITVASVITALEGPISLTECSSTDHSCDQVAACQIGNNWRVVNQTVQQALESVTLADMMLPVSLPKEITVPVASLYR
ncbi:SUF system Fe-S cluster assembly regulator [methanotrophic endosymbiont of Bathymodiolus puteoserpentis (Logatchev)]|jgi:FeS assembly SUF system regulator|uniref:SUF system Fe-S cluster assembly regulator n=1 Tax=methanotrophic endosymbiont of Bathymodiolus puteoserpentis (Logatchev) TaxID=343235 RepID=UPI0013C5FD23|nr:SUF system Fe-S cluster assembly regulator [methanotrophic endosymbiont of Bathymodiolus puteoserpentis (Logatchev)]SHE22315.1 Iron-sulfur cluster regulator IscR [methanotrophic endosymbiont of Bathymodiolus puteoserpentis (Logatchev)]